MSVFACLKLFTAGGGVRQRKMNRKKTCISFAFESACYGILVYIMPPLLGLLYWFFSHVPQPPNFVMHRDSVLSHLFSLHSLSGHVLALNAFMVTIPNLCFHPRALPSMSNSSMNISTRLSNWHLKLTLPKWNTWFPPSNLVFPHLSKWYLHSFCDSDQIS